MQQILNITDSPKQKLSILLENNKYFDLYLNYYMNSSTVLNLYVGNKNAQLIRDKQIIE